MTDKNNLFFIEWDEKSSAQSLLLRRVEPEHWVILPLPVRLREAAVMGRQCE